MTDETTGQAKQVPVCGQHSFTTCLLIAKLEHGKPGDEVTDADLTAHCHKNTAPGGAGYGNLQSALRYCERGGAVWRRVPGEKRLLCLNGVGVLSLAKDSRTHVRRTVRRTRQRLATVDPVELPDDGERRRYIGECTVAAFTEHASKEKTVAKIENKEVPQLDYSAKVIALCRDT